MQNRFTLWSVAALLLVIGVVAVGVWHIGPCVRGNDAAVANKARQKGETGSDQAEQRKTSGETDKTPLPPSWKRYKNLRTRYHVFLDGYAKTVRKAAPPTVSRDAFKKALGWPTQCGETPHVSLNLESVAEKDAYRVLDVRAKVGCEDVAPGLALPGSGLLAMPPDGRPVKGLIVTIHGTAASAEQIFGLEADRYFPVNDYHHEFAARAAARGFAVFAPRLMTDPHRDVAVNIRHKDNSFNGSRNALDRRGEVLGLRLHGMETFVLKHVVQTLANRPRLRDSRIGVYGISLGGAAAFFLTAATPEIDAAVISQWMEVRTDKLVSREHDTAMWRYEDGDYTILPKAVRHLRDAQVARSFIRPRPLFIEVGARDYRSDSVQPLYRDLRAMYPGKAARHGRLCLAIEPGGHRIFFDKPMRFLDYWLHKETGEHEQAPSWCPQDAQ